MPDIVLQYSLPIRKIEKIKKQRYLADFRNTVN